MTKANACARHTEYLAVFNMPDNDVSDCSFLPGLQFTEGDIFDPFEILLVVRKKM